MIENLFVDPAFVVLPPPPDQENTVLSGLWKNFDYLVNTFFPTKSNRFIGQLTVDNMCGFTDLGGVRYIPKGKSVCRGVSYMQAFCLFKHMDFERTKNLMRPSDDLSANDVWTNSRAVSTWVKKRLYDLSLAEKRSYGVRLEFRVAAGSAKKLFKFVRSVEKEVVRFGPFEELLTQII